MMIVQEHFRIKGRGNVIMVDVPNEDLGRFIQAGMHLEQNGKRWKIIGVERRFSGSVYNRTKSYLISGDRDEFPEHNEIRCVEYIMHDALG